MQRVSRASRRVDSHWISMAKSEQSDPLIKYGENQSENSTHSPRRVAFDSAARNQRTGVAGLGDQRRAIRSEPMGDGDVPGKIGPEAGGRLSHGLYEVRFCGERHDQGPAFPHSEQGISARSALSIGR